MERRDRWNLSSLFGHGGATAVGFVEMFITERIQDESALN